MATRLRGSHVSTGDLAVGMRPMDLQSPDLDSRFGPLAGFDGPHLVGSGAQEWKIEIVENPTERWLVELPEGALVFAENGYGDHLFLRPDADGVFAFWHEGPEITAFHPPKERCSNPAGRCRSP